MSKKKRSAPYPKTSPAEIESRNIFQSLLDSRYVKGEIRVLDKVPNSDGILELTDIDQYPIGKIDIQLKTMPETHAKKPRYACDAAFLAYCQRPQLPVIIIVVNRKEKKAYWRHLDEEFVNETLSKLKGAKTTIPIPITNCIDGNNLDYITQWTQLAKDVIDKVYNYKALKEQKDKLEIGLADLNQYLQNPTNIPISTLRLFHDFIDSYNYILDREFLAIKKILYPDYWRIGMGVSRYSAEHLSFVLFPVPFTKEQTLIKKIQHKSWENISMDFINKSVLLAADWGNLSELSNPKKAYDLVKSDVLRVLKNHIFPISDLFIAHEYLYSFCKMVKDLFDLQQTNNTFSIDDLKLKLFGILPIVLGNKKGFADWVTEFDYDIDRDLSISDKEKHRIQLSRSHDLLKIGAKSKVKITIISKRFDIDVIKFYIDFLENRGYNRVNSQYQQGAITKHVFGLNDWQGWNKDVFWNNIKLFFRNFHRVKEQFLIQHFPNLKDKLSITIHKELLVIYVLHWNEDSEGRPFLEEFFLRPGIRIEGDVRFYLAEDQKCPVNRECIFKARKYDCNLDGMDYRVVRLRTQSLNFLLKDSPTYHLLNEMFHKEVTTYFSNQTPQEKHSLS